MTLRQRLALHYGVMVVLSLLLLGALAYHEFGVEPHLWEQTGAVPPTESEWGEATEVLVYAMIPVILALGWWGTRRSLQPLADLAQAVERIGVHSLGEPVPRTGNADEVDRLSAAFNTMAARLGESIQQIHTFTLNASHELKTPLTVMRGEIETALQRLSPQADAERECLHNLLDEVDRLTKIVTALTLLSKADAGQVELQRAPVDLGELVRESHEDALILAEPQHVQVSLGDCASVIVTGDRHRLRQLLLNLVDNAVRYNQPGGSVTLSLTRAGDDAELIIRNTGPGIPADLLPRVFDRFVRGEQARQLAADGSGLGLPIAQWIVQSHGGTIEIVSVPGGETTVTVHLPAAAESSPIPPRPTERNA